MFKPVGCKRCNHSGYRGRQGIYEIVPIDSELRRMIHDKASEDEMIIQARINGRSILDDGIDKILSRHHNSRRSFTCDSRGLRRVAAFSYIAIDSGGKQQKGVVDADSARQVRQILRDKGLMATDVSATIKDADPQKNFLFLLVVPH